MQLTYRGAQYDYKPTALEMKDTFETGKYRGVDIRFRTVKKNPVQQPTLDLMYRGVAYQTGNSQAAPAPFVSQSSPAKATYEALASTEA